MSAVVACVLAVAVMGGEARYASVGVQCVGEGRVAHPGDCTKYVECIAHHDTFRQRERQCHNSAFSQDLAMCVPFQKTDCKFAPRSVRSISDLSYSAFCRSKSDGYYCSDCKTLINCVDGQAYPHACTTGESCLEMPAFNQAVCYPDDGSKCSCKAKGFLQDYYNIGKFLQCSESGAEPVMHQCQEDHFFSEAATKCVHNSDLQECVTSGTFARLSDCSYYYTCIATTHGWLQQVFNCSEKQMYNEASGVCEDPCSWGNVEFTCSAEGRFPDPRDCQRYYVCISGPGGFRKLVRHCPVGYSWSPEALDGVGHCVREDINTNCPVTPAKSKCHIPESLCGGNTSSSNGLSSTPLSLPQPPSTTETIVIPSEVFSSTSTPLGDTTIASATEEVLAPVFRRVVAGQAPRKPQGVRRANKRSPELFPVQ